MKNSDSRNSKNRPLNEMTIRLDNDPFYVQISRLNNELVNIQRQLTKKTLDLERKTAELKEKSAQLQRMNELKNEMMGMAAHDLRSPLSSIMALSELLLESEQDIGSLNENQQEFVDEIHRSSKFMLNMIDEMLDFSQIESGNISMDVQEVNLVESLQHAVKLHNILAQEKNITILFEADIFEHPSYPDGERMATNRDLFETPHATPQGHEPHEIKIRADPNKLEQVFNNLIGNAIKYSPEKTTIRVSLQKASTGDPVFKKRNIEAGDLLIHIRDQGPGISSEEQKKLFKPFSRIHKKTGRNTRSTGLGLAITRKIVEAHGWGIHVDSTVDEGSVFTIHIPATTRSGADETT